MRYRSHSVYSSPALYSTVHRRWTRLLVLLLATSLLTAVGVTAVLYAHFKLSGGPSGPQLLTTTLGQTLRVQIAGRTEDVVKLITPEDGAVHYLPLSSLSAGDRAQVAALPPTLTLGYPIQSVLTDQRNRTLQVIILGRTTGDIRFTRLDNQKSYTYPITSLSAADQSFIRSLPLIAAPSTTPTAASLIASTSAPSDLMTRMQELIAELVVPPDNAPTDPNSADARLSTDTSALLNTLASLQSPSKTTPLAQAAQIAQLHKQIAQVSSDLLKNLSGNESTGDAALEQQLLATQTRLLQVYQQQSQQAAPDNVAAK